MTGQEGTQLVDGVPVLLAPRGDGPCAGGLLFRVGVVDETPRWRGVSHLVEHLALAPLAGTSSHYNGETTIDTTGFHIQGSESQVVEFLRAVCGLLGDLPVAELEREKAVVRTEEAGRSGSVADSLAVYRFGARSYGRTSLPEWGIGGLTAESVRRWARHFFTRGNVVCWLVADRVPADLRLPLPDGPRQLPPEPTSALPQTPAYYPAGSGLIAWSTVVERSTPAVVLAQVLRRDLFRSLRTDAGLSYDVGSVYSPRAGGVADLLLSADALEEKQDAALGTFLRGLTRLKLGRLAEEDLAAVRSERLALYRRDDAERLMLASRAYDELVGHPFLSLPHAVAELEAVTLDAVARVGQQAFGAGLLRVPAGRGAENAGFVRAPDSSAKAVPGQRFAAYENPAVSITVGPAGVTWSNGSGFATVTYDDCEALVVYPDGGRRLLGGDGIAVGVEPTLYAGLGSAVATIDASVPRDTHVEVPRVADDVPQVDPAAQQRIHQEQRRRRPAAKIATAAIVLLLVIGWAFVATMLLGGGIQASEGDSEAIFPIIIAVVMGVPLGLVTVRWWSRRRGR